MSYLLGAVVLFAIVYGATRMAIRDADNARSRQR